MRKVLMTMMVFALLVSCGTGFAQIVEKTSDISGYGGIMKFDGGSSELMFGARYNYNMSVNGSIEGTFGLALPDNGKILFYHANYRYNLTLSNEMLVPFFTGGVGAVTTSPDQGDGDANLSINFGGGMQYFTSPNLAIRIDVRDHMIFVGDRTVTVDIGGVQHSQTIKGETTNNIEFSGGITYFFI